MGSSSYANLNDEEYWLSGGNQKLTKNDRTRDYWTAVDAAAGAKAKQQGKRGSWGNVYASSQRVAKDGNAIHDPEPNARQQQLNRDLADPENQRIATLLNLKNLDSGEDMAQVWNYKFGNRPAAPAPVDTAKAEQAVSSAQTWRAINRQDGATPEQQPAAEVESATSYASGGGQGEGWSPSTSYAQALQGGPSGGDSVYDLIARRGREGSETFRRIGADYLQQARQSSDEIGLANQRAVDGLKGKLTDFLNPWTDKLANGKTLRDNMKNFMDG